MAFFGAKVEFFLSKAVFETFQGRRFLYFFILSQTVIDCLWWVESKSCERPLCGLTHQQSLEILTFPCCSHVKVLFLQR